MDYLCLTKGKSLGRHPDGVTRKDLRSFLWQCGHRGGLPQDLDPLRRHRLDRARPVYCLRAARHLLRSPFGPVRWRIWGSKYSARKQARRTGCQSISLFCLAINSWHYHTTALIIKQSNSYQFHIHRRQSIFPKENVQDYTWAQD